MAADPGREGASSDFGNLVSSCALVSRVDSKFSVAGAGEGSVKMKNSRDR